MSAWVVMLKEITDNLRDRQTLFYALLFGPVLLPLLFGGAIVASIKQMSIDFDAVDSLSVINAEAAPNLVQFLYSQNIDVVQASDSFTSDLRQGDASAVLEITDDFAPALREASPAPLILHINSADKDSVRFARRVTLILNLYDQTISALRMQHRGIDPDIFKTLQITQNDLSENGSHGQLLASLLPFVFIVSMVMGGYYLAIDTTAGERERQSLEPLLSLPVSRLAIVTGKYGATACFVALSCLLSAVSIYCLFRFFPIELMMGGRISFDAGILAKAFLLVSPLIFFISAVLITVSAMTRSTKQAQTYLGLMMVFPMLPFFLLQYFDLSPGLLTMPVPMLSHYQLLESVVLGNIVAPSHVALSILGTLGFTLVLLAIANTFYQKESILI